MTRLWANLSARDRNVLLVGAALALALLLWALVWEPLTHSRDTLRSEAIAQAADLTWMRPAVAAALAGPARGAAPAADGRSLLARVDAGARDAGLAGALLSVEPQGAGRVRIQLVGADFDLLATWLQDVARRGIGVEELSAQRAAGDGRVDAHITLREALAASQPANGTAR